MLLLYHFSEHESELRRINPTLTVAQHRNQFASWFDERISYVNVHHDLKVCLYSIYFAKLNLLIVLLIVDSSVTYRQS